MASVKGSQYSVNTSAHHYETVLIIVIGLIFTLTQCDHTIRALQFQLDA